MLKIVYDITLGDKGGQIHVVFDGAQLPSRSSMMTDSEPLETSDLVSNSMWGLGMIPAGVRTAFGDRPNSR